MDKNFKIALDKALAGDDRIAMSYMVGREVVNVTAGVLYHDILARSRWVVSAGLQDQHVALQGVNSYEWIINYCAMVYCGCVPVLLMRDWKGEDIRKHMLQTDCKYLLQVQDTCGTGETVFMDIDENVIEMKPADPSLVIENHKEADDLGTIIFTSGTTGENKAVMLCNRGMLFQFYFVTPGLEYDSFLDLLPLHHIGGFGVVMNNIILKQRICLGKNPMHIVRYLTQMKPQAGFVVPALLDIICKKLEGANGDKAALGWDLRALTCGGAKFNPEVLNIANKSGIIICQIYSSSEMCGQGFYCNMEDNNKNSIGMPNESVSIRIDDSGEMLLRGVTMMMGYYKDDEETNRTLKDGWYHTGDLARLGDDGFYYLIGRKKNLIILSNGENISPEEIEAKLSAIPGVLEVIVGEEKDFLNVEFYLEEGASRELVEAEVKKYNKGAETYKQLPFVHFRETPFEKNALGKIMRKNVTQN